MYTMAGGIHLIMGKEGLEFLCSKCGMPILLGVHGVGQNSFKSGICLGSGRMGQKCNQCNTM